MRTYPPRYQIIKTEGFIKKTQSLGKHYHGIPELIKGVEWDLSRKPHNFQNVSGDYYLWVTEKLENESFPEITILYLIDTSENKVILIEISEK